MRLSGNCFRTSTRSRWKVPGLLVFFSLHLELRSTEIVLVGAGRFERPTPCAQGRCATRLRYAPTFAGLFILDHLPKFPPSASLRQCTPLFFHFQCPREKNIVFEVNVPVKIAFEFGEPVIQGAVSGACIRRRTITARQ